MAAHQPVGFAAASAITDLEAKIREGRDFDWTLSWEVAHAILAAWNEGNRPLRELRVQRHRRAMERGKFQAGHVIGFGLLNGQVRVGDGQHRMAAQVITKTSQTYRVRVFASDVEFNLFVMACDPAGGARTLGDILTILNVCAASAAPRFERVINAIVGFYGQTRSRQTMDERTAEAARFATPIKYVLGLPQKQFKAHVLAAIALVHMKHGVKVEKFIADVISGKEARGITLDFIRALPEFNAARTAADKDRVMGVVMRVLYDAIKGRARSTTRTGGGLEGNAYHESIADVCGWDVADAWIGRRKHEHGR